MVNDPSEDRRDPQPPADGDASARSGGSAGRRHRRYRSSRTRPPEAATQPTPSSDAPLQASQPEAADAAAPKPRRHRGGVRHRRGQQATEPEAAPAPEAPAEAQPEGHAPAMAQPEAAEPVEPRRRRHRGGVKHRRGQRAGAQAEATPTAEAPVEAQPEARQPAAAQPETPEQAAAKPRRHRGGVRHRRGRAAEPTAPPPAEIEAAVRPEAEDWPDEEFEEIAEEGAGLVPSPLPPGSPGSGSGAGPAPRRTRGDRNGAGPRTKPFMHPSEGEFAKLLDYYDIKYLYEPRSFPLRWDGNRVVEMFTPDFYLPAQDQYIELTTMKQNLVTQKNRKLRRVRELYPEVNVMLLYRRDLLRLLGKYGYGPLSDAEVRGVEHVLFTAEQIQERVRELGAQIAKDYASKEPILIGVLRGVVMFMADLMRAIDLPVQISFMEISHYGEDSAGGVEVVKDVDIDIAGKPVILVEDIVDTGMTVTRLLKHLEGKRPAGVAVCTLLDKTVRRMVQVPVHYRGFDIPDEFVVGYGLDYQGRYRNLPYIGVLKPAEPKDIPLLQGAYTS